MIVGKTVEFVDCRQDERWRGTVVAAQAIKSNDYGVNTDYVWTLLVQTSGQLTWGSANRFRVIEETK